MDRLVQAVHYCLAIRRWRQALVLLGWLVLVGSAVAQQFPYIAYVTGEQIYVRSGPGQRYYPTGQVSQGFAVEVYRHDGDRWCAVRPPEGSFSWVPSHQVRAVGSNIVEIVDDHVVARVGSALSPDRSAVQVLLPKGEQVEIFSADENDDPRWVRVAAPAGEFRWIAASDLSRQPPIEIAPLPQTSGEIRSQQPDPLQGTREAEPTAFGHLDESATVRTGLQFRATNTLPIDKPAPVIPNDPSTMDVVAGSPADLQLAQFQSQPPSASALSLLNDSAPSSTAPTSSRPRVRFRGMKSIVPATVSSVEELELRLSQAVVQPPKQWELGPLETAANALLEETKTPPIRAQLREVIDRITRFQEVQQRYNDPQPPALPERDPFAITSPEDKPSELTGLTSDVRERVRQDLALRPGAPSQGPNSAAEKPLYDAAGLLKPVVSKREQAPQYALVDEQGKVVSFVTPTPDLNLKPYVGRRIGVHGKRGFMPEYRRAHVTAGRVTPIEGIIRR